MNDGSMRKTQTLDMDMDKSKIFKFMLNEIDKLSRSTSLSLSLMPWPNADFYPINSLGPTFNFYVIIAYVTS